MLLMWRDCLAEISLLPRETNVLRPAVRLSYVRTRRRNAVKMAASLNGAKKVEKVVLAYSGGLDTSVILKWLQETYDCEVVTFTADLGQVKRAQPQAGLII